MAIVKSVVLPTITDAFYYDRRKAIIGSVEVSMVRCIEDMHIHSPSTGEVSIRRAGYWEEIWSGHAADAGGTFAYVVGMLEDGASVDEVMDACM